MKEGTERSGGMWLLSCMTAAGAALCGRFDWLSALAAGVLGALLCRVCPGPGALPRALRALQALWLAMPLGVLARAARDLFPDASGSLYIPAVVLGLAWLLAGQSRSGRLACCAVVGFFVLGAVGIVSLFSLPKLTPGWLIPAPTPEGFLCALALGSGGMLLRAAAGEPAGAWIRGAYLVPAVLSALAGGCLSCPLAARQASAFYTLSRGVSLFGVAERFEALIAACLTLGLCSACALLLCAARELLGSDRAVLLIPASIGTCFLPIRGLYIAAGTVLLWLLPPVFFKIRVCKKLPKKSKKSS